MREKRGQLSSLDLIPEDAYHEILWAMGELNAHKRTQADILFELNDRIAVFGCEPISRSAFNRAAIRAETARRRHDERAAIIATLKDKATPDKIGEGDLILAELLKTLITAILDAENLTSDDAINLARAYKAAIEGQTLSADLLRAKHAEFNAKLNQVGETVAKAKGLSADVRAKIFEQLGIVGRSA